MAIRARGFDWQALDALSLSLQLNRKAGYFYSDSDDIRAQAVTLMALNVRYQVENTSVTLWSRNLLDNTYGVQGFFFGNDPRDGYSDHLYEQLGEPRRIGVTVKVQF